MLENIWRQWTAIGVAGQVENPASSLIDPEAILLCTLALGRYDARLFDEIIDWLYVNGEFINVQRLTALQEQYKFDAAPQLSAIAEYLSQKSEYRLKWQRVSELYKTDGEHALFYTVTGKPLPVGNDRDGYFLKKGLIRNKVTLRHYSSPFPVEGAPSLLLRLRALIGVSARSELICVLAGETEVHSAQVARLTGYNRKTVQNALREMSRSGVVECRESEREKYYRMKAFPFDPNTPEKVQWISWAPLYKGIEILWNGLAEEKEDPLVASSQLRQTAKNAQKYFEESQTGIYLTEPSRTPGADYIDVYTTDLHRIADEFERKV